jgi:hypothetical protein
MTYRLWVTGIVHHKNLPLEDSYAAKVDSSPGRPGQQGL